LSLSWPGEYKKTIAGKLALLVFLGLSQACAEPVTIEMWGLTEQRLFMGTFAAIQEFEKRNPEIRVVTGSPGGQGHLDPQKLLTAVVSRTPPDVIWFGRNNTGLWAPRGAFLPLDTLIKRDGINLDDYYPGTIGEVQWEGKTYALPWNMDCRALFYNKDILDAHGLERPPATWAELKTYTEQLTIYDESRGRYDLLGFAPNYGNAWLFLYSWQLGANWLSPDGRKAQLTSPSIVDALQYMVEMSDAAGGAEKIRAFTSSAQYEGMGDPFLSDRVAMQITGNWVLDYIARLRPDMNFVVSPPPMPEPGMKPLSWSGGFSWVIPTDAKHPEEAWKFIRWMNSEEAWIVQCDAQKRYALETEGPEALFVPFYHANRRINERLAHRYTKDLPERFQEAAQVCLDLLPSCRFLPLTPASGELWDAQANVIVDATFHIRTPEETLGIYQDRLQGALDRFFQPPTGKLLHAADIVLGVGIVVALLLTCGVLFFTLRLRSYAGMERKRALSGVKYVLPWIAGFALLVIGPMLYSLVMAFMRYDVIHPPEWIGLGNWSRMFGFHTSELGLQANDPQFWKSLWNTFYIVLFGVPIGLVVSLMLALLLNTNVRGMKLYRTLFYVPVMVPVVASSFMFIWLLNPETGFVNFALNPLLYKVGLSAPAWFVDARWAKPGLILLLTWGCGGTVIIWLAGLQTLPKQVYEAAVLDGAGPWQRFRYVTLPLLTPYALFLWIMGTIGSLQIFTQAYLIAAPGDALLFYALYLFHRAFRYFEMGFACAMAWVLFLITVLVCLAQLYVSRKYVHYEGEH
jgi:ABC-type sugar transport system permease subunit/ABC-type glycerol-3-phosphate transport system substrate-binding protein